jgi:hypothetical protein
MLVGEADVGSRLVNSFDHRVLLMSQDMAVFGALGSSGSEKIRWHGNDARSIEYFAA